MKVIYLFTIHIVLLGESIPQFIRNVEPGYLTYNQPIHEQRWPRRFNKFYRSGKFAQYSAEYYDNIRPYCQCNCRNCPNIKPCCLSLCNCNPQKLVFVPYPVPLVITMTSKTSVDAKLTTISTKKTTKPTKSKESTSVETFSTPAFTRVKPHKNDFDLSTFPYFDRNKKLPLSKKKCLRDRCPNYRRDFDTLKNDIARDEKYSDLEFEIQSSKPHSFGIIPIPDKLALEFMTEMRNFKLNELQKYKG